MYKLGGYLLLSCVTLQYCLGQNELLDEESSCSEHDISWSCKRVRNCPVAIENIIKTRSTGLERCGFIGKDELVCCPPVKVRESEFMIPIGKEDDDDDSPEQQNRFTKRKCEQACEKLSNAANSRVAFHIIGGTNASNGEFPHMAALGYQTDEGMSWDCSASVISNRFLLTAAHCIANNKQLLPKIARLGITKLDDSNPQDYTIKNITINPRYNPSSKHHDIALIEVSKEIEFTETVFPACLYWENDDPLGLVVTGWGKTTISLDDDRSNILQKATLVATPLDQCNISYVKRSTGTKTIIHTQLCAGSNSSDACWGDSGGPLQIQTNGSFSIVGIISYGAGCGGKIPGVYTRVSRYLEWIEKMVWP